jgi:hypothetical protein
LKVHSDIAKTIDEESIAAVILLDLAAACNIVDQTILLNWLNISFDTKERP